MVGNSACKIGSILSLLHLSFTISNTSRYFSSCFDLWDKSCKNQELDLNAFNNLAKEGFNINSAGSHK